MYWERIDPSFRHGTRAYHIEDAAVQRRNDQRRNEYTAQSIQLSNQETARRQAQEAVENERKAAALAQRQAQEAERQQERDEHDRKLLVEREKRLREEKRLEKELMAKKDQEIKDKETLAKLNEPILNVVKTKIVSDIEKQQVDDINNFFKDAGMFKPEPQKIAFNAIQKAVLEKINAKKARRESLFTPLNEIEVIKPHETALNNLLHGDDKPGLICCFFAPPPLELHEQLKRLEKSLESRTKAALDRIKILDNEKHIPHDKLRGKYKHVLDERAVTSTSVYR